MKLKDLEADLSLLTNSIKKMKSVNQEILDIGNEVALVKNDLLKDLKRFRGV